MNYRESQSEYLHKEPCPACGSRDNLARYSDGHGYCFGCGHWEKGDEEQMGEVLELSRLPAEEGREQEKVLSFTGETKDLGARRIREETCRHWSYRVGSLNGTPAQFAYYLDPVTRKPVAAKVRYPDKTFTWIGDPKKAPLYGQWLCRDGGKLLVVTEGEIDALSVSQVQNLKWPVVSVENGAQGAARSIRKHLDFINRFETVVFMFDMDDAGRKAAIECAKLLPPGKAKIANLNNAKDANELLVAARGPEIVDAIWGAQTYRPDGIVNASDLYSRVLSHGTGVGVDYPYVGLTQKTGGIRKRELVTITAGSGIGKSLFCREVAYDLMMKKGWKVGYVALEESPERTLLGLMGIHLDRPVHISREGIEPDDFDAAFKAVSERLFLFDSFGSIDPDNLLDRLRYLAVGMQCDALVLDHVSIAISGLEDIDERRALDVIMTKLRSLVEETGVALFVVSHLKRPSQSDRGHEQGLQTSLAQLRGSHAIAQLSDIVIGLERDQQGDDPNKTLIRVLKNRFNGDTGIANELMYSKTTGRLTEQAFTPEDEDVPF